MTDNFLFWGTSEVLEGTYDRKKEKQKRMDEESGGGEDGEKNWR